MNVKLLKIGEFAKLCQTTKDTILHYEKKGLLKACFIDSNNYRYYATSQYLIFDRIKLLQDAGYSLTDIKEANSNEHCYSDYIGNTLLKIQNQIAKLKLKENMLKQILELINEIDQCKFDYLQFEYREAKPILSYSLIEPKKVNTVDDSIKLYKQIMELIVTEQNHEQLVLGIELDVNELKNNTVTKIICSTDAINQQHFIQDTIDKALYAVYYHIDDFKGHSNCIFKLKNQIEEQGYKIEKIYIIDIYSIFSNDLCEKSYKAKYLFKLQSS